MNHDAAEDDAKALARAARRILTPAACVLLALAGGACNGTPTQAQSGTIALSVTDAGFEPDRVKVKKGVPVKLVITRKTDATCAKDIVIDELKIHQKLPLNTPVTVSFTPTKSGEIKYGCAMDKMVSGILVIE